MPICEQHIQSSCLARFACKGLPPTPSRGPTHKLQTLPCLWLQQSLGETLLEDYVPKPCCTFACHDVDRPCQRSDAFRGYVGGNQGWLGLRLWKYHDLINARMCVPPQLWRRGKQAGLARFQRIPLPHTIST